MNLLQSVIVDLLPVLVFADDTQLGQAAADDLAAILKDAVQKNGETSIILATGNSQLPFMKALRQKNDLPWEHIYCFHMDEYIGMSDQHTASFRRYIREQIVNHVNPKEFYGIQGDAVDIQAELARYRRLLIEHPPVATVLGIGENGHLAFNDPPADFHTEAVIHVVDLDEACRQQQVNEGHFPTLDFVPTQAISLTVPALLATAHVLAIVPEKRKAAVVARTLHGPVTPDCPASILRTFPHAKLYLDPESASQL
ncbi:MAG: glucosamine-6-phosphate deaminase [Chloroflexi bacterium]|nr:glucosamine-6-phosphate deaminase [Chloroflexota bacterium]